MLMSALHMQQKSSLLKESHCILMNSLLLIELCHEAVHPQEARRPAIRNQTKVGKRMVKRVKPIWFCAVN